VDHGPWGRTQLGSAPASHRTNRHRDTGKGGRSGPPSPDGAGKQDYLFRWCRFRSDPQITRIDANNEDEVAGIMETKGSSS